MEQNGKHEKLSDIISEVSKIVVGKDDIKEMILIALLSQGHVLIEGLPGSAKTTLARSFAQAIGGKFMRVQGTPDMLPSDILGFYHYQESTTTFMPGPIFANVVLLDELNRTTPRTQAALLEAMQERQVTIEGETHPLEQPFFVIASQVPYGRAGTYPLSDVQIDRFFFRIWCNFPNTSEESRILENIDQIMEHNISAVVDLADIVQLQEEVENVYVAESIRYYIINILEKIRHHQDLVYGPGPRAGISLFKGGRARAFIHGRDYVIPDDIKQILVPSLYHRMQISTEAEMEDVTPETIITKSISEVPVPKQSSQEDRTAEVTETTVEAVIGEVTGENVLSAQDTHIETAEEPGEANLEEMGDELSSKVEDALTLAREAKAKIEQTSPALGILEGWRGAVILFIFFLTILFLYLKVFLFN